MSSGLVRALAMGDVRRVARDQFLVGCFVYVLLLASGLRLAFPSVVAVVLERFGTNLQPYQPLVASYVAISAGALISGVIGAFLLLESKEDGTLMAVLVSPLPLGRYLWWESLLVYAVAVPVILLTAVIVGGAPRAPVLVAAALVAGGVAPLVMLAVTARVKDKVEAFAALKIVGFLGFIPTSMWFVPESWRWLGFVLPTYGPLQAWWSASIGAGPSVLGSLAGGTVSLLVWMAWAYWSFVHRARRP